MRKIFYNGYKYEKGHKDNKILILNFNNGEFEFVPKWEDMTEIFSQILYIENLNFGKNMYGSHYPPHIQDFIRVVSYYLWKNPKILNKNELNRLDNAINKIKDLGRPKFQDHYKLLQIKPENPKQDNHLLGKFKLIQLTFTKKEMRKLVDTFPEKFGKII